MNPTQVIRKAYLTLATHRVVQKLLKGFKNKVNLSLEKGSFLVKTVDHPSELAAVLRLRHEVFHKEFLGEKLPLEIDMDDYDALGDHLIIMDQEKKKIVGTYRLICSKFSPSFYSTSEFELSQFLKEPSVKLELSRACIHQDYRTGAVINLLWRGLVQYLQTVKADYLFGCASIRTMESEEVNAILAYLSNRGYLNEQYAIRPHADYKMHGVLSSAAPEEVVAKGKGLIPPLLSSYLRAGAKVCGEPALDRSFQCVDFFTILKMDEVTKIYEKRYQPNT